ncbi:MAG: hypothetical protein JNM86_02555 [Phycisphaerae bacterium]|nr:hypothetical protein [Phycisphaerae bacterium]
MYGPSVTFGHSSEPAPGFIGAFGSTTCPVVGVVGAVAFGWFAPGFVGCADPPELGAAGFPWLVWGEPPGDVVVLGLGAVGKRGAVVGAVVGEVDWAGCEGAAGAG